MDAIRDVMQMNIARRSGAVDTKCSRFTKLSFAAPSFYRCRPISSGSSVDSEMTLTGRPLARLYA